MGHAVEQEESGHGTGWPQPKEGPWIRVGVRVRVRRTLHGFQGSNTFRVRARVTGRLLA